MKKRYDAIIIGGGHNGLVTAGYLAKAGLSVAVFERRYITGGCAVTEEPWEGFKISSLSYVNSLFKPEIIDDLNLRQHGFEMLPREPSSFTPFPNGDYLMLGPDKKMNIEQISKFSKKDAKAYPLYEKMLDDMSQILEPMMTMVPPNPAKLNFSDLCTYGWFGLKNKSKLEKDWAELTRLMTGSATDMLDEWFESEELKTTLATDAVIGANASPSMPGTAYVLFHHVMGECNGVRGVWGYMRGGMGGLTQSLTKSCVSLGVDIFTSSPIEKILVKNGRVSGVLTKEGNEVLANIVASNADCENTFMKLMDEKDLPDNFVRDVKRINYDSASVKINLALDGLPNFTACPSDKAGPWHRGTIHISPDMQYIEDAYSDSVAKRPSERPILECTIPSVVDNTLAPSGKHVMNVFTQYGPYELRDGLSWETEKEKYMDRVIDILTEYAPNLKDIVLHRQMFTPQDIEKEYGATGGSLFHGRMTLDQMFAMRPVPGYANYRSPIKGLYMCGSSCHPGGGVMGTPGLNASKEILKDR
ncbi:MAG: NAD(P)/FAD-dependent oxidoreductase [Candidatus Cloacimonetes bacterium]|nr:NAD(P)/FAD-dependent oxidoreductase [Candidatus Cloacimonadota bacterium]